MSIFKKKGGQVNAANVHMTEAEAALAQSDFNIEKITDIQNKFTGGAVLLVPGRIFIREGSLYKVCRKGLKKRQFFLFNDILVYGSVVAGRYSNQQILPLAQMSVSSDCFYQPRVDADFISETDEENLDVINAFQISHANKSFHVFGQSAADKANWIANLQKHISRVAKTLSDSQQQVITRPVWVPDSMSKECMICSTKFTAFVRKHHCRRCGRVVCSSCSPHRVSLNVGEGLGVAPGGGGHGGEPHQGKLERTCRECFKEMTAVHNRANSTSTLNKYDAIKTTPSRPPPPAVAAQIVSEAIRSATTPPREDGKPPEIKEHVDSSTDTEDSDDSSNEQVESTSAPIPAKRSSKPETSRPVPKARKSIKSEPSPPIPARRSHPTSSNDSSPSLLERASNHFAGNEEDEPQPTPPPRKKKLLKQKLKEQEQQDSAQVEEEKREKDEADNPPSSESPSTKKTRRRNKYFKPQDEPKTTDAVKGEAGDAVKGEGGDAVKGEGGDAVKDEAGDDVKDKAGDAVTGEGGDNEKDEPNTKESVVGVMSEAGDGVTSEASDGVNGMPESTTPDPTTVSNSDSQTNNPGGVTSEAGVTSGAGEANDGVKEGGDSSPGEVAVKRGGRRRQKFKPTAQN